jgi:uncharacterized protein (TIGR02145 family)
MPVSNDFGEIGNYTMSSPYNNTVTVSATPENGTNVITNAYYLYTTASYEGVTFPASGYRFSDYGGALYLVGGYGYYWSSSVSDASSAYLLNFNSRDVYPAINDTHAFGLSVRCVLK